MRRLLLLALAAAPALVLAQTLPLPAPGKVSFGSERHSQVDEYINAAECAGGKLHVRWDVENAGSAATTVTKYTVYAHNRTNAHTETSTLDCPTADREGQDNALFANSIGTFDVTTSDNTIPASGATQTIELEAAAIVSVSGKSCSTTSDEEIVICVQANNNGGTARGKVTLTTRAPGKPVGVVAGSGSGALNVDWSEPGGSPAAEYYMVEAVFAGTTTQAIDPTTIPTTVRSGTLTATSYRLAGLTNTAVYDVHVYAFSAADNRSASSDTVQGRPELANDFWNSYRNAGGQEEGGCGVGAAGPLGLLLAAAAVALRRRRS